MVWTKFQFIICAMMVCSGTVNVVLTKWCYSRVAAGWGGKKLSFHHPYLQSTCLFIAEAILLIIYKLSYFIFNRKGIDTEKSALTRGNKDFDVWILCIPAWLDLIGTTLALIALVRTYAGSYMMLRGSTVIFTGTFSVIFLKRVLKWRAWLGIFIVVIGLILVGLSDFLVGGSDNAQFTVADILLGDGLIIIANFLIAIQMVYEEKFVIRWYINACQAIGWEGVFGLTTIVFLNVPFFYIHAKGFGTNSRKVIEDIPEAFLQIADDNWLILALSCYIISVCFFNFAALSITKELSATTRIVMSTIHTFFIYLFSLFLFGQTFYWLQVVGFLALVCGIYLYNNISCGWLSKRCEIHKEGAPIIAEADPKEISTVV